MSGAETEGLVTKLVTRFTPQLAYTSVTIGVIGIIMHENREV